MDKQKMLLELMRKGQQEVGVRPPGRVASTLHNRKDVTSVRVEGFPSPDAKTMREVTDDDDGQKSELSPAAE